MVIFSPPIAHTCVWTSIYISRPLDLTTAKPSVSPIASETYSKGLLCCAVIYPPLLPINGLQLSFLFFFFFYSGTDKISNRFHGWRFGIFGETHFWVMGIYIWINSLFFTLMSVLVSMRIVSMDWYRLGIHAWVLSPQFLWTVYKGLGGMTLLEEVCHWG